MTTSYSREELEALVRLVLERAPPVPAAKDLEKAFGITAITMAGSDAGMLLNIGLTHDQKPLFFFLNCVIARELYGAIESAEANVWSSTAGTVPYADELITPTIQDIDSAAEVLSLTTAAEPQGILVNLRGTGEALMIYMARDVALKLIAGITIAAETAGWWDKDYKLFPVDTPPRHVEEMDVWRAANQIIQVYPDDAVFEASQRADTALAQGDVFNFLLWERVLAAVRNLRRQKSDGERIN